MSLSDKLSELSNSHPVLVGVACFTVLASAVVWGKLAYSHHKEAKESIHAGKIINTTSNDFFTLNNAYASAKDLFMLKGRDWPEEERIRLNSGLAAVEGNIKVYEVALEKAQISYQTKDFQFFYDPNIQSSYTSYSSQMRRDLENVKSFVDTYQSK